jgi:hypothetical protein
MFRSALRTAETDIAAIHIHGPGGVGKTALIQQFAGIAEQAGRTVVRVEARDLAPTTHGLLVALASALHTGPVELDELAACWPPSSVLIIDSYESVSALDEWLRQRLLPRLPVATLVVLAGRQPPALAWSTDVEWAPLTRIVALNNLDAEEAKAYLSMRGVAAPSQASIIAAVQGYPLALSLAADAVSNAAPELAAFEISEHPNMVQALLHRLVDRVPDAQHRSALHACVAVRLLTEPMLAAALARDDAHAEFDWLSSLAFVESTAEGLVVHDLAREVLYADFRQQGYERRLELNGRLLRYLYERFWNTSDAHQQQQWFDVIYVQRYNAALRPFFSWRTGATFFAAPLRSDEDRAAVLAMTHRHEGALSANIAGHWLNRQPQAFLGFRDLRGELAGYIANIRLDLATENDRQLDPAVDRALQFIHQSAPARAGEEIAYFRFWMGRDDYQSHTDTMTVLAANASLYWTTHPSLAWSLCSVADPKHFEPLFSNIRMHRACAADFELDNHTWGVFAHDWRSETAMQWLMMKVDRASQDEPTLPQRLEPLLVLSETAFAAAVQEALRDFGRSDALATNALLRTRLFADAREHRKPSVESLRMLLREAAASLETAKDRKSQTAILYTYFEPVGTQEKAAERMGVPFNTYRYQLARGTQRIVRWLWARETGALGPQPS